MPTKSAVDKLVTRYFNSYDPAVHILHSPTFHKELHNHWQDPSKSSIVWLGLLYSILCLAMQSYHKIGDEPLEWKGKSRKFLSLRRNTNAISGRTNELAAEYRLRTVSLQPLLVMAFSTMPLFNISKFQSSCIHDRAALIQRTYRCNASSTQITQSRQRILLRRSCFTYMASTQAGGMLRWVFGL